MGKSKKRSDARPKAERAADKRPQSSKRRLGRISESISGLFSAHSLTIISAAIAVAVVALVIYSRTNLVNKYDEQAKKAAESNTASEVKKPEKSNLYELTESETNPGLTFPRSDAAGEDGRPLVDVSLGADGSVVSAIYYSYDDSGSLRYISEYSGNGRLVSKTVYPSAEDDKYSEYSNVIMTVEYDKSGNFNGYTTSCRDAAGVERKKESHSSGGVLEQYSLIEYDGEGRLKKETFYSSYNSVSSCSEYEYDEAGNKIAKLQYDESGNEKIRELFMYDDENRLIREECYIASVCRSFSEYYYDETGGRTKFVSTLADEGTMTYEKKQVFE